MSDPNLILMGFFKIFLFVLPYAKAVMTAMLSVAKISVLIKGAYSSVVKLEHSVIKCGIH